MRSVPRVAMRAPVLASPTMDREREPWDFEAFARHYTEIARQRGGWEFDPLGDWPSAVFESAAQVVPRLDTENDLRSALTVRRSR